jgi:hypothetical protein
VLEHILLAEMTIVTGIITGGAIFVVATIQKIKSTVGPIVGLINLIGAKQG